MKNKVSPDLMFVYLKIVVIMMDFKAKTRGELIHPPNLFKFDWEPSPFRVNKTYWSYLKSKIMFRTDLQLS